MDYTDKNLNSFNDSLEEVLDKYFPMGKCKERSSALVLFAEAVHLYKNDLKESYERGKADGMTEEGIKCFDHGKVEYEKGVKAERKRILEEYGGFSDGCGCCSSTDIRTELSKTHEE